MRSNNMRMLSLCLAKKYAKRWLSLRIVTYLIEYLSEFEFIFETVLGYVSGGQMDYFEAKKTKSKISCLGTFKQRHIYKLVPADSYLPKTQTREKEPA